MALNNIVPWGRSLAEYKGMFDLKPTEFRLKLLDCAAGPASFNAELHELGFSVVSYDPLYRFSAAEIAQRIEETYDAIPDATRQGQENFVWRQIPSMEELGERRRRSFCRISRQGFSRDVIGQPSCRTFHPATVNLIYRLARTSSLHIRMF